MKHLPRLLFLGASLLAAPALAGPAAPAAPAPAPAAPAPSSAADIVAQVQKFYAQVTQVSAQFRQSVTNTTFGSTKTSDGKVYLLKPGKMRWDYAATKGGVTTVKKNFISDGKTLWVVDRDNQQVFKKDIKSDLLPVAVTFLYGQGNLNDEFTGELDKSGKYGEKGDWVLKLTPKKPSAQYKHLYLVVNPQQFRVTQSIIVDSSDNVNHFRFYDPDFEKKIDSKLFDFNPASVPSYRIVNGDDPNDGLLTGGAPANAPAAPTPAPKH